MACRLRYILTDTTSVNYLTAAHYGSQPMQINHSACKNRESKCPDWAPAAYRYSVNNIPHS